MKTIITGFIAVSFVISYILYLYTMATQPCSQSAMKLWNYYSIGGLCLGIWAMEYIKTDTDLQESIIIGSKLLLLLIFADIILTYHGLIKDPYYNLIVFMGGSLLAITLLLIELIKSYGKLWLILAIILLVLFFGFLQVYVVPLTLKQPIGL